MIDVYVSVYVPGITNTLGRVLAGFMADLKWVNSMLLHNIALMCAGVACVLNMFANTYVTMCVFCAGFGLCVGKEKKICCHHIGSG